jgi:WD40 repeat protein
MKILIRKCLNCAIIILLFGISIIPVICGTINKNYSSLKKGDNPDILWEIEGHTRSVYAVSFSHDGQTVASGADDPDNTAKLWQADDGNLLYTYPDNDDGILSVDISSDYEFLAVGYIVTGYPPGGKMNLWDISEETLVNDFGGCHVSFSPDGEFIASGGGGANRYLYVHRVSNGEKIWGDSTGTYISDVKYSPNGQYVASSGSDNKIQLWNAQTGELIRTFSGHTNDISCIAFSPDGEMIASGTGGWDTSGESNIKIWKVSDGSLIKTLEGHGDWVYDVEFVPDGEYLVSSGREDTSPLIQKIIFWRVSSGDILLEYDEQALNIAYSPLGNLFVYGKSSGNVVVANSPILPENNAPNKPDIEGPDNGIPGTEYLYAFKANDPDNDDIYYFIDWGNGDIEEWLGPYSSGELVIINHIWDAEGTFKIRAKVKDNLNAESDWAELEVTMPYLYNPSSWFNNLLDRFPFLNRLIGRFIC